MTTSFRTPSSLLACALLSFTTTSGVFANAPRLLPAARAVAMAPVTVSITMSSGTVWGKVTARYTFRGHAASRSCTAARCTLRVPQGAMLHLTQVARDSATWPFKNWQVNVNHRSRTMPAHSIAIAVQGSVSVTAVYVVAGSSSGSGGYYP